MDSSSRAFRSTTYWKDLFLIGGFLWATVEIVLRALAGNSKEFHPSVLSSKKSMDRVSRAIRSLIACGFDKLSTERKPDILERRSDAKG
jgi:hypothetical protein